MRLRFLGKDSTPTNSPTLYATDRASFVVQGWIVDAADRPAQVEVNSEETIVEVPPGLMTFLIKDGLEGPVTNVVPPIVHVTDSGNLVIRGRRVHDAVALEQMDIPDHETCVEVPRSALAALLIGG